MAEDSIFTEPEAPETVVPDPEPEVAPETEVSEPEPTARVSLSAKSELEAPVAVRVPGLRDAEGEALVDTDEHGRIVLDTSPTEVPASVARSLGDLPFVEVSA